MSDPDKDHEHNRNAKALPPHRTHGPTTVTLTPGGAVVLSTLAKRRRRHNDLTGHPFGRKLLRCAAKVILRHSSAIAGLCWPGRARKPSDFVVSQGVVAPEMPSRPARAFAPVTAPPPTSGITMSREFVTLRLRNC
jgi:hypothetical protein